MTEVKNPNRTDSMSKVALVSLGCPKNLIDSEVMLGRLAQSGRMICDRPDDADIIIINTCGFIDDAKQESVDSILQAIHMKNGSHRKVVVTGCMAQRFGEELLREIPEIDAVVDIGGEAGIERICNDLETVMNEERGECAVVRQPTNIGSADTARLRLTPRHYAYVRIADGCDNRCSYCVISHIRGPYRSKPLEKVIEEVRELAADGAVEINVVAQDTTMYGGDLDGSPALHELLKDIAAVDGVRWIRLLYTHPAHFSDGLVEAIAETDEIVKYVDLPIQHINSRILKMMGRKCDRKRIEDLIRQMRERIDGLFIRSSLIVGFPGETEKDFQELLDFVGEVEFERLGVFTYSCEEGTPAATYDGHLSEEIKQERFAAIMEAQQKVAFKKNRQLIDKDMEILVDRSSEKVGGAWEGRTYGDAPEVDGLVYVTGAGLRAGALCAARITGTEGYDLKAEVLRGGNGATE